MAMIRRRMAVFGNIFGFCGYISADGAPVDPESVLVKNVFPGLDLLPSHLDLFTMDLDIGAVVARETLLKRALEPVLPGL